MTDEAQQRLNSWIKWGFQGLLAAVLGWMAINIEASRKKSEEQAASLIRMEARVEALGVMTSDRYTMTHAQADWRVQQLVDERQNEEREDMVAAVREDMEAAVRRHNEWLGRLSDRLRAVEANQRDEGG